MSNSRRLCDRRPHATSIVLPGLVLVIAFGTTACRDVVAPSDAEIGYSISAVGASKRAAASHLQARQDAFPVTSVHVAWLAQPAPEILPSGNATFEGWEHLWYDDAADDLLDGYDTVVIKGMFGAGGNIVYAHGTFTVREKLDDYQFDDFLDGNFDLNQIVQGQILWEGRFELTPQRGLVAEAMNGDGLKAFYLFPHPFEFPVLHSVARVVSPSGT